MFEGCAQGTWASLNTPFVCGDQVTGGDGDTNDYGSVTGGDGNCWLDRNLGATQFATSSADPDSFGWYYQWGRKNDEHQNQASQAPNVLSTAIPWNSTSINFIKLNEWASGDSTGTNRQTGWGVNGVNNPCPARWHVPTLAEWIAVKNATPLITNAASAFTNPLKLPVPGSRSYSSASLANAGYGHYWSSTPVNGSTTSSYQFLFKIAATPNTTGWRGEGRSVRCIRD